MIHNLQLLRALAAGMIVLIHLQPMLVPLGFHEAYDGLYAGIDIFFVLSGFIMVYTGERRMPSAREFAFDRLIRIAPAYWLFSAVLFAVSFVLPVQATAPPTFAGLLASLAFVPGPAAPQFMPVLFVGWTLNLEVYFYALFALALATGAGRDVRLLLVGGAILGVCLALPLLLPPAARLRFYAMPIACEFVLGMVVARLRQVLVRLPRLLGLAFAGAAVVWLVAVARVGIDHTSLAYAGPAVLIVVAALVLEARVTESGPGVCRRAVEAVAAASYVLYVSHPLVISAIANIQRRVGALQGQAGAAVTWLVALAACLVFSLLVHRGLEAPVIAWLRSRIRPTLRTESGAVGEHVIAASGTKS